MSSSSCGFESHYRRLASILYKYTPAELQKLLDTSNGYCDLLRKVGLNGHGSNPETLKKIIKEYNLDITQNSINRSNLYKTCAKKAHTKNSYKLEDIINGKHPNYQSSMLLKRLVNEGYKEYKCEICGITEWNNKHISLVLHHINGKHEDNNISNLQILCPNCHSKTDNYSGKAHRKEKNSEVCTSNNIRKKEKLLKLPPISREELKSKIRNNSFTSIAKEYGVSDNTIRKWCKKYLLPSQKYVINSYTDQQWEEI